MSPTRQPTTWTLALVCYALGCSTGQPPFDAAARATVTRSVDSALQAFAAAERSRDAERTVSHIAPDFYMYNDGNRVGYDSVAAQIRRTFPAMQRFDFTWEDIDIRLLGPQHAFVTFTFRDHITMNDGSTLRFRGPTTLVWERRGDDWLIIFADADHYADSIPGR